MKTAMDQTIGDYQLLRELGKGSLGTLYLAEHRFLKKKFALKLLSSEYTSDSGFLNRLDKEITLLASLNHPHIVPIHNVSQTDGHTYIVSDVIFDLLGVTTNIAQYLSRDETAPSEEVMVSMAKQVASALDFARPITHLGLKLSNILVGHSEGSLHLYLSDFGLSRVVGEGSLLRRTYDAVARLLEGKAQETLCDTFLQNFSFLAPEQKSWNRQAAQVGREDAYAFGVFLYYLLMRKFPEGVFEEPSRRYSGLTGDWDGLIRSCLQSEPQERPLSLVAAVEKHLSNDDRSSMPKPLLKPSEIVRPSYDHDPKSALQVDSHVYGYKVEAKEKEQIKPLQTEMVVISGGDYFRGSDLGSRDETPYHAIYLNSFALDVHPVTNLQFSLFLEAMEGEKDADNNDMICLRYSRIKRKAGKVFIESGYAKHPVVGVSWYGAVAYAKWVGKRLPTEAEWEVAAACGQIENIFPTGSAIERSQANFFNADTTAVMSYPPNGWGLYDMAGNVYEWCEDWYSYHYYATSVQEPDNPKGPYQGVYRVLRGGCWKSLKEDLRSSHRHRNNPGTMTATYGFRCAADVSS